MDDDYHGADRRGALVGVITQWYIQDGKIRAVADVIEGAALHDGRMDMK